MSSRNGSSPDPSSHHHRAQLLWTGAVALILAAMAMSQAADPGYYIATGESAEAVATGNASLDASLRSIPDLPVGTRLPSSSTAAIRPAPRRP